MGNCASSKSTDDYHYGMQNQPLMRGTEYTPQLNASGLDCQKLHAVFIKHCDAVKGIIKATTVQQELLDELVQLIRPGDEKASEPSKHLIAARESLKNMQGAYEIKKSTLHETATELYNNIQRNLNSVNETPFEIVSPLQMDDYQHSTRTQNTVAKKKTSIDNEMKDILKWKKLLVDQLRIEQRRQGNETMQRKPESVKPKTIPSAIQLFHLHSGNTIKEIEAELGRVLKPRLNGISFVDRNQHTDIDYSQKLIVLSIITSRIETDAASAIKDIKNPGKTALVLIHVKEAHALRDQRSTSILSDQKFKNLGGIFDLAFTSGHGFYHCKMNDDALEGICSYIKKKTESLSTQL